MQMWTGKNPWRGWENTLEWLGAYPKEHCGSEEIICHWNGLPSGPAATLWALPGIGHLGGGKEQTNS